MRTGSCEILLLISSHSFTAPAASVILANNQSTQDIISVFAFLIPARNGVSSCPAPRSHPEEYPPIPIATEIEEISDYLFSELGLSRGRRSLVQEENAFFQQIS